MKRAFVFMLGIGILLISSLSLGNVVHRPAEGSVNLPAFSQLHELTNISFCTASDENFL